MSTLLGIPTSNNILTPESCTPEVQNETLLGTYDKNICHIKPKDQECKHQVLLRENYLSEFFTKSEKQKVLENLGLNQQVDWGEIGGYIEKQEDLMGKFTKLNDLISQNYEELSVKLNEGIESLSEKINSEILTALTFPNESPYNSTEYTIGGLLKGSDIRNKSLMEVLNGFLYPEYLPKFTDATSPSLTYSGSSTRTFEVGSPLPLLSDFKASVGSPAFVTAGNYKVYGGNGTCSDIVGTTTAGGQIGNTESITTKKGSCTFSVICNYAAGTEPIKTTKGNNTQYTSSNDNTLVASGTDTSHTYQLEDGWGLKEIAGKSASITFQYQYKFFATTEQIGVLNSGTLRDSLGQWDVTLKAGGGNKSMFFIVPPGVTVKSIKGYNEVSRDYDQDQTSNFETSSYEYTLPSGATVTYTKYAYKSAPTENFKIRIT